MKFEMKSRMFDPKEEWSIPGISSTPPAANPPHLFHRQATSSCRPSACIDICLRHAARCHIASGLLHLCVSLLEVHNLQTGKRTRQAMAAMALRETTQRCILTTQYLRLLSGTGNEASETVIWVFKTRASKGATFVKHELSPSIKYP